MNPAHQRGRPSTSSVKSFDESNEHATDYISGMYQDTSSEPLPPLSLYNHRPPVSPLRKREVPSLHTKTTTTSSNNASRSNATPQSPPSASVYQRSQSSERISTSPERKSPTLTRPRFRAPSPPPKLSTQIPLSGLDDDDDGSSPSSPAEIAKELSNLQYFKRMSLDVNNQVSDPDLPSNRMSIPDFSELLEAGVDEDAARLLWVPAHLHPEIAANDDWKDFVQRRVEETKTTGTIGRVKSISGGSSTRRLSRAKSILSRQIDPSDEETWSKYSDAGHKELERRASRDSGTPERHMITVAELEKLEALIKEGALGRPVSGEGFESPEVIPPLAADVPPPVEDIPPLMPMKGTLRRSGHTSMRNVRRGGKGAPFRSARRSSEPQRETSRNSQASASDEDGILRSGEQIDGSKISPTSQNHERNESFPMLDRVTSDPGERSAQPELPEKPRITTLPTLDKVELQSLTTPVLHVHQSPEPIIEASDVLLGQVQPRQLRRPPLRRQTIDAPESLSPPPPPSPTKDRVPDRTLKKSPVSPLFPPSDPTLPMVVEERLSQQTVQQYQPGQVSPKYAQFQQPLPPTPEPQAPASQPSSTSKKNAWTRLFASSSDDEAVSNREKSQSKGKIKKAASLTEGQKTSGAIPERETSAELERVKSSAEPIPSPVLKSTSPPPPPPSSQKQSGKKESGLFASLFGSKKKSQESKEKQSKNQDSPAVSSKSGAQDRSQYQRHGPGGWGDQGNAVAGPPVLNYYYNRFPIHVERAIYRLSHIKLANPRRPLLQQVLLSNFMYGYLNLINKAAQPQPQEVPQQPQQDIYVEPQSEDHVFYSGDDHSEYYGQDYYGAEYDDDQEDSIPQGHEQDEMDYRDNSGYQPQVSQKLGKNSSAQGPSQNSSYNKVLPHTYDQPNGRRHDPLDSEDDNASGGNTFILRDSRGRTLSLPKSGASSIGGGNSWAGGSQDEPSHMGKRYH